MRNKILKGLLIVLLIIWLLTVSVSALSFTATMTPSATIVNESTEFTITIKVSNLDVGTNGINSLSGYLKYDSEVFEPISESSIEGLNSWSVKYDETTQKIELTKSTFVTSTQEVFQITFKTKSGVNGKKGTISYSDIIASNSESNIQATDISTSITIGTATSSDTSNSSNITQIAPANNTVKINATTNTSQNTIALVNSLSNNTTNNTTNNVVSSYVNTITNTNSESNMPKTGVDDTVMKAIFVFIGIAIIFYIKIEKINNDMR